MIMGMAMIMMSGSFCIYFEIKKLWFYCLYCVLIRMFF